MTTDTTLSHYRRFVRDWLRLEAWYAWHLVQHAGLAADEVLEGRIYLFRRAYAREEGGWEAWKAECACRLAALDGTDTVAFEQWLLAEEAPWLARYLAMHFAAEYRAPLNTPYAGFSFDYTPEYRAGEAGEVCLTLHFRNAFTPESPFQHADALRDALQRLVARSRIERPEVIRVQCGSWLNSLSPFQALFPANWHRTATPGAPGAHLGWWGQFMDRTGAFHARHGAYLRQTGEFPYRHLLCSCLLNELQTHLST